MIPATYKFTDLKALADMIGDYKNASEIWSDIEYQLTVMPRELGDGSVVYDFEINSVIEDPIQTGDTAQFRSGYGKLWTVRILRAGDKYGLNDCLTWGDDGRENDPVGGVGVEFYDADSKDGDGQFVSRYYYGTLAGMKGFYGSGECRTNGLNLHGGVDAWKIEPQTMNKIMDYLKHNIEGK